MCVRAAIVNVGLTEGCESLEEVLADIGVVAIGAVPEHVESIGVKGCVGAAPAFFWWCGHASGSADGFLCYAEVDCSGAKELVDFRCLVEGSPGWYKLVGIGFVVRGDALIGQHVGVFGGGGVREVFLGGGSRNGRPGKAGEKMVRAKTRSTRALGV